jgi:hypothetical protein
LACQNLSLQNVGPLTFLIHVFAHLQKRMATPALKINLKTSNSDEIKQLGDISVACTFLSNELITLPIKKEKLFH